MLSFILYLRFTILSSSLQNFISFTNILAHNYTNTSLLSSSEINHSSHLSFTTRIHSLTPTDIYTPNPYYFISIVFYIIQSILFTSFFTTFLSFLHSLFTKLISFHSYFSLPVLLLVEWHTPPLSSPYLQQHRLFKDILPTPLLLLPQEQMT